MIIAKRKFGKRVRNIPGPRITDRKRRSLSFPGVVLWIFLGALCVNQALATALSGGPVVAIHDSELTRALETMPATNPGTPTGAGASGFEWWPTNWHYFVMPESLKEALRSDGTAFEVVSDADISA